ncbi:MAG: 5-bromo-4-chloroindolyl phosphate hydrolysis family protein [Tissierellia bacterium]|nr:5-bromo-4-chloroindolyl phosphate hydrolysis family protein [Tissierellia bacterium]MDD4780200.1 5-bromo-4-chloroindolyl phosphate hydrolysis family protein [Tissierellia bacterium]
MNNRGNSNLGDEIFNIVQDALNNGDFNRLNRNIKSVVNSALNEVRRSFNWNKGSQTWNNPTWKVNDYSYDYYRDLEKFTVPVGKVSGMLLTIFGSIGSVGAAIASIVLAIIGYSLNIRIMFNIISLGLLPLFIGGIVLLFNGSRIRKRLKRYQKYVATLNGRNYCMIEELSFVARRNNKHVAKDLQNMIDIGMFPEGHIDHKKTCFMLNNESYEQYLKLMENIRKREMEEQANNNEKSENNRYYKSDNLDPEIRKAINEGRQYVRKIKEANIEIPGEEISRKLDRLEEVTGKIFDYVETHPEKFFEIKKFTEYFLPTTLKLVDAYKEFDYQPVQGENISNAKKEIEKTMDTINHAFENLLDDLFEDAAMDISTDISVLETMFAQEGLAKKNNKF